jgi:hypothetical protein
MKRAILNEVLSRKPDKPLYHYTTQSGLLGIIEHKQIWATHTQYLNDRREFLHAIDLVRHEIDEMLGTVEPQNHQIFADMRDGLAGHESINVCVCSFSEERDSLSQWRAYAGGTSGFAIGFPGDLLVAATQKLRWLRFAKILCAPKIARFPAATAVPSKLSLLPRAPRFSPGGTPARCTCIY